MKRTLLFLILGFALLSCEKPETTYQIVNNASEMTETLEPLMDGTLYEVIVFRYINEDVAGQDAIEPVKFGGGKSKTVTLPDNIEKVKLSFKLIPPESPYYNISANSRKYLVAYTYIDEEKNNIIEVNDNSMVSNYPKSGEEIPLGKFLNTIK